MKYLFFVQSSLTIYLVKHYIQVNKIDAGNTIIFYTRVSLTEIEMLPGKKIDFLKVFYRKFVNVNKTHLQMLQLTWASIKKVNDFIQKEVAGDFVLVTPHLIWDIKQLFAGSSCCKKIIYLEEGDMSYASEAEVQHKLATMETYTGEKWRSLISLGKLFRKHPFQDRKKQHEAICLHEEAFPFPYIKKNIYSFREVFKNDQYVFSEDYNHSVIVLLEHITWMNEQQREAYYLKLRNVLKGIMEQFGSHIYMKPHPELFADVQRHHFILQLIQECGLQAKLISDPIELIVTHFEDVKIFAHRSSLIRYCCYAGVKPYVWGLSLVSGAERKSNTLAFKFLDKHAGQVCLVE